MYITKEAHRKRKVTPKRTPGRDYAKGLVLAFAIFSILTAGPLIKDRVRSRLAGTAVENSLRNISSPLFNGPQNTKEKVILKNSTRYNYALSSCGAKILYSSQGTSHPSSILNPSMDAYMLTDCIHLKDPPTFSKEAISQGGNEAKNGEDTNGALEEAWVIIELCQAIRTDGIELANFELFSASFKNVSVYGSFGSPSQDSWVLLGNFVTDNVLQSQKFALTPVWCRYIRISVHSHWGSEPFCTLSSIKIFGNSLVEDMVMWQEENTNTNKASTESDQSSHQLNADVSTNTQAISAQQNSDDDDVEDSDEVNVTQDDGITHENREEEEEKEEEEEEEEEENKTDNTLDNITLNESNSNEEDEVDYTNNEAHTHENEVARQEKVETRPQTQHKEGNSIYLELLDHEFAKNLFRTSLENTTTLFQHKKHVLQKSLPTNDTNTNTSTSNVSESEPVESDKSTTKGINNKLLTPQLPFEKLKIKCNHKHIFFSFI